MTTPIESGRIDISVSDRSSVFNIVKAPIESGKVETFFVTDLTNANS